MNKIIINKLILQYQLNKIGFKLQLKKIKQNYNKILNNNKLQNNKDKINNNNYINNNYYNNN